MLKQSTLIGWAIIFQLVKQPFVGEQTGRGLTPKLKSQPAENWWNSFAVLLWKVKYLSVSSVAMQQMKGSVAEEKTGRGSTWGATSCQPNGNPQKVLRTGGRLDNYYFYNALNLLLTESDKDVKAAGDDPWSFFCWMFSTGAIIHSNHCEANSTAQTAVESEEEIDKCPSTKNCIWIGFNVNPRGKTDPKC